MKEESGPKRVRFTKDRVENWCERNGDDNPLHTDPIAAENGVFGQRVVPGMMLIDQLSGMLADMGEEDETIVLAGITAARFRDPVLFEEEVTFSIETSREDTNPTTVDFEARVEERDSLVAHGVLSVAVD